MKPVNPPAEFTLTAVIDAVVSAIPLRDVLIHGRQRFTYAQIHERSQRLASYLRAHGLGCHTERNLLVNHQSGQDLIGIYAYNGNEFIETLLAAFRARCAPFNVNFRYTRSELSQLLADSNATALVYQAEFAPLVEQVRHEHPNLHVLIQINDESGNDLLDGAMDYEAATATTPSSLLPPQAPDDLYVLYTGGTTGVPKGVLWRQHDLFVSALGGREFLSDSLIVAYERIAQRARDAPQERRMILPPLMHGAAQWAVLTGMIAGQTLVFPTDTGKLDAADVVRTVEELRVDALAVVGDAMARPILQAIETEGVDVSSIKIFASGGAPLTGATKRRILNAIPAVHVIDGVGSSESGAQMHSVVAGAAGTVASDFFPGPDTAVLTGDLSGIAIPGSEDLGWLAQHTHIPLGYLGDAAKTATVFLTVGDKRFAVAGDRVRLNTNGSITFVGRHSQTINSGGEKVFVEEVEAALASHPAVADVVVTGRPDDRWGEVIVAIAALKEGVSVLPGDLLEHANCTLARYKLPKEIVFRSSIKRSPSGKADYRWARQQAVEARNPV